MKQKYLVFVFCLFVMEDFKTYESSATAICVWILSNWTLRRADMPLPLAALCSGDVSVGSCGIGCNWTGFGRRIRFRWPRCCCCFFGRLSFELELAVLARDSEMLFNLIVGKWLSSANGMTPLSRRFDLLYPAPFIVTFSL